MNYEDYMLYIIENYVSDILENLYDEEKTCGFDKERTLDIKFLENLNTDDYIKITDLVFDDEIRNKLFENLEYYLWRYDKGENNNE